MHVHMNGTPNDPVNSRSLSLLSPLLVIALLPLEGAFIYLRNTSRDSIWHMYMLAPLVARLFVHFIRRSLSAIFFVFLSFLSFSSFY